MYYVNRDRDVMVVTVAPDGVGLKIGTPKLLFKAGLDYNNAHPIDVTADGQKFVMQMPQETPDQVSRFAVVSNWQERLRKTQ
jgi:hypothetical protein